MRFDLSQIPANAMIQSATLQLSLVNADSSSNPTYACRCTKSSTGIRIWRVRPLCPNGTTDLDRPCLLFDEHPDGPGGHLSSACDHRHGQAALGTETWDAMSLVQTWRATPATNYGLLLKAGFASKLAGTVTSPAWNHAVVSERPVLRVTYTVPATGGETTAPTVAITAPANNATVSGTNVSVTANARTAVGVVGVQFQLDGVSLGAEDTTAPYSTPGAPLRP